MFTLRPALAFAVLSGLALSGCAGSGRFGDFGFGPPPRAAAAPQAEPAPLPAPRTAPVVSEPLPPPSYPGGGPATLPGQSPPPAGGPPMNVSGLPPTVPGAPPPSPSAPSPLPPVAAAPPPAAPSQIAAPSASGAVGSWTARDATGAACRVTLSSAPALDLNKASASGCANRDLSRINAWKQQGGEIYLYSAGAVVARLPAGGSSMSGVLARSGAPLTLSR